MQSVFDLMQFSQLVAFCLLVETLFQAKGAQRGETTPKRVCYFGGWAQKRQQPAARTTIDQLDPSLCTHLIYAFGYIDTTHLDVTGAEWDDESNGNVVGSFEKFNQLKLFNPRLKTLISVGGEKAGSWPFEVITTNLTNALRFGRNVAQFLQRWDFDGIDIDWEFPSEPEKFTLLLKTLRKTLRSAESKAGRRLLLSVAVGVSEEHITNGYDIPTISSLVDFINMMTYGFHGSWDRFTAGNAPLYPRTRDKRFNPKNNIEWIVGEWLRRGAPRSKLILGVSAQARSYTLADPSHAGVGAPALGPGLPGRYTQEAGTLAYFEICEVMSKNDAKTKWDKKQKFPYTSYGNQWLSFDNRRSIAIKAQFALSRHLAGVMIWSLDTDDVTGRFCGEGPFPLTSTVKGVLIGKQSRQRERSIITNKGKALELDIIGSLLSGTVVHISLLLVKLIR